MKIRHRIASLVLLVLMLTSAAGCTLYGIGDMTAARTEAESTSPAVTVIEDTTEENLYIPTRCPTSTARRSACSSGRMRP